MMDYLRNTQPHDLTKFAIWTFGGGVALAGLVSLVWGIDGLQLIVARGPEVVPGWRETLQISATAMTQRMAFGSIICMALSWLVLQQACVKDIRPWGKPLASAVYVISMLATVATLSAITFLMIVQS